MPRAPDFWARPGLLSDLLLPLAWGHAALTSTRRRFAHPWRAGVPVLCVGNLVAGGAGKTPVCLSLAQLLGARGWHAHLLSRGYGGSLGGPVRVDPQRHSAAEVGDEPLLLARAAPVWIGSDRASAARAAIAAGADLLILDDGFQNTSLHQDLALVVIDGATGLGNGRVIPAGPLREPPGSGLARAEAAIVIGEDKTGLVLPGSIVLRATLAPRGATDLAGKKVVGFAGIGRPTKFRDTLEELGAAIAGWHAFPDHHPYRETELARLAEEASGANAMLVTTEKDLMRLTPLWRQHVRAIAVEIAWRDEAALLAVLAPILSRAHGP